MNSISIRTMRHALFAVLLLPVAAHAVSWRGADHVQVREGAGHGPLYDAPQTSIGPTDAAAIVAYYQSHAAGLSAGQAHVWSVGQKLPGSAPAEPLPPELNAKVSPLYGFHYERVGGDVVLLADGTRIVAAGMQIVVR